VTAAEPVWLIDGVRTPFGRFGGSLRDVRLPDLGAHVVRTLLDRAPGAADVVDELNVGIAMIEGGMMVPARQIQFAAGLPETLPTLTVDRACCSGLTAAALGVRAIRSGARATIGLGIESMSRTPRLLHETRWGMRRGDLEIEDVLMLRSPLSGTAIANYAGHEALARGIDRAMQDRWAVQSHERWFAARDAGWFDDEVVPIDVESGRFTYDEQPREGTTVERLAQLPTVYDSPTVTAGNAPGLNDGACALLLGDASAVEAAGRRPLARIIAYVQVAGSATSAVYLPGKAIRHLVEEAGLEVSDLDVVEINEAYAATALASARELAGGDPGLEDELHAKTNVHGGAVAIGHPTGASGARILLTAARALQHQGGRWAAVAICGGFGQTDAVLLGTA